MSEVTRHKDRPTFNVLPCVCVYLYMWVSSTMSVHMCVCAHVRTCVHVYECITCESGHKHSHSTHQILCMDICAYTYVCAYLHACRRVYLCVCICVCVQERQTVFAGRLA